MGFIANQENVRIGAHGWFFLDPGSDRDAEPVRKAGADISAAWVELLQSRSRLLSDRSIKYIFLPAPDKNTVLHQYYDGSVAESHDSVIRVISDNYHKDVPCFINLLPKFKKQVEKYPLYWKTASHWSSVGCFSAYQQLCMRMGIKPRVDIFQCPHRDTDFLFDLGALLKEPIRENVRIYELVQKAKRVYANPLVRFIEDSGRSLSDDLLSGAHIVYKNSTPDVADLKVVLFGDGFSDYRSFLLTGMLAESVKELHFIWNSRLDYEYIDFVKPDIVISESSESSMYKVPVDDLCIQEHSKLQLQRLKKKWAHQQENITYVEEGSIKETKILDKEVYDLPIVNAVQPLCKNVESGNGVKSNEVKLVEVDHAKLYFDGASCILQAGNGRQVAHYGKCAQDKLEPWAVSRKLSGTTLLLGYSQGAHCYYHWMMDILPRIGLLESVGVTLDNIDHILIRELNHSFQRETLTRLGVDLSKVIETKNDSLFACEKLLHVKLQNGIGMKMHRFVPQWLKQTFRSEIKADERVKLYITRPGQVRRGISNEKELLPVLEKYGYSVSAMEGMTVIEQAELLAKTDVLVSPHGGALTNMVFAKPGIDVVELFGSHVYPFYYGLSAACGHRYHAILEDPALNFSRLVKYEEAVKAGSPAQQRKTNAQSFTVDPLYFEQILELIG